MQKQIRQLPVPYMPGKAFQPYSLLQNLEIPGKLWQVMTVMEIRGVLEGKAGQSHMVSCRC